MQSFDKILGVAWHPTILLVHVASMTWSMTLNVNVCYCLDEVELLSRVYVVIVIACVPDKWQILVKAIAPQLFIDERKAFIAGTWRISCHNGNRRENSKRSATVSRHVQHKRWPHFIEHETIDIVWRSFSVALLMRKASIRIRESMPSIDWLSSHETNVLL